MTRLSQLCAAVLCGCLLAVLTVPPPGAWAQSAPPDSVNGLPLVYTEDFEDGMDGWEPTDTDAWRVEEIDGNHVLSLYQQSEYEPPVRSPYNMALIEGLWVSDFVLEARMASTTDPYNHLDMCLFFGWQDPAHFYYSHLGASADPHANSIFLVNDAPRVSIANWRTDGTDWGQEVWHTVRIVRDTEAGTIAVYFDDMDRPIMVAEDDHFRIGRLGVGSFDDTGWIDDVRIWADEVEVGS